MTAPLILFLISLAGVAAGFALPGATDLLLVAVPSALASLYLLIRARKGPDRAARKKAERFVVIDGSNVMYWQDNTPRIKTLHEVIGNLKSHGFAPGVVFDANAGYLLTGSYQHDGSFARVLELPEGRVMVVPKGIPADPLVLTAARDLGARVISNDRFRDWAGDHPELAAPGHLVRGGYRDGKLWLSLDDAPAPLP